jgi:hypothetical protein
LLAKLDGALRSSDSSGGLDKNWDGAKLAQQIQADA